MKVYQKPNLGVDESTRLREYPMSDYRCKTPEAVVNCLNQNLTEIPMPVLATGLDKMKLSYIPVFFQLKDRGWVEDNETRTLHKVETKVSDVID